MNNWKHFTQITNLLDYDLLTLLLLRRSLMLSQVSPFSYFVHSQLLLHGSHTRSRHWLSKTLLIIAHAVINRIRRSRTSDVNNMCNAHFIMLQYNSRTKKRELSYNMFSFLYNMFSKTRNAFNFTRHSRATILLLLLTKCSHFYTNRAVSPKWNFVAWIITKRSHINEDAMCH